MTVCHTHDVCETRFHKILVIPPSDLCINKGSPCHCEWMHAILVLQLVCHCTTVFPTPRTNDDVVTTVQAPVSVAQIPQFALPLLPIDDIFLLVGILASAAHSIPVKLNTRPLVGDNTLLTKNNFFGL